MNPLSLLTALAVFAAAGLGSANASEPYPSRPITIVVPYPAGGSDIQVRKIQTALSESLGQPVIVENKPGASGAIAAVSVARAKPDGYTLLHANNGLLITPIVNKRAGYNLLKDFKPVSTLTTSPMVLLVKSDFPAKNLADFLHYAREQPNGLRYASSGTASLTHIETARLGDAARIKLQHIPYKGTGPALNDLLGGQVSMTFTDILTALPYIKSGKLHALGVATAQRSQALPQVPTIAEQGYKGYDVSVFFGIVAPAATPPDRIAKLNKAFVEVLAQPKVKELFAAQGLESAPDSSPQQLARFITSETGKWKSVVAASGAQLD